MTIRRLFFRWARAAAVTAAPVWAATTSAHAQPPAAAPLSLGAALREGERDAFVLRRAAAATATAAARARGARAGVVPQLRVEAGAVRTTDPIGAFGALLRQRQVTTAAFNPTTLNNPAPITTVQSTVVTDVPLVNADAWAGRRAAQAAADATAHTEAWQRAAYRRDVVGAYFGAVLAAEQVRVLEHAARAATAAARQVEAMVREGLVTKADALQADVRVAQVDAQLLAARNEALTAREGMALLLGRTTGVLPVLPDSLPSSTTVRALAASDTASAGRDADPLTRADVRAARDGVLAADADAARALGTMLPRLNGFARYDWFTNDVPFGGAKAWTVGVMASWSVFGGGRELADRQAAHATQRAAQSGAAAVLAQSAQEIASTRRGIAVALRQLQLAEHAAGQSREAFRLVDRRYAGGLATIAERLGAEATATAASLAQSAAVQQVIVALAAHRLATGRDPGALTVLDSER